MSSTAATRPGMGLTALFCLSVGTMIGVGWITLLGSWLAAAGSLGAMAAFLLGGLIILPVVFCYAEATSVVPDAGGEIAFARLAGGATAGFVAGWILMLVFLGVVAFEAISVAWIAGVLFPPILGPVVYKVLGAEVHLGAVVIGLGGTLAIALLHLAGNRSIEKLQNFATLAKLAVSLVFVGAGLIFGHPANLAPIFAAPGSAGGGGWAGFLSVLAVTPLFYAGFNAMIQAVTERDARISLQQVGWVLVGSVLVAMVFYCGVIGAAALSAPRAVLLASDLPAAAAFESIFNSPWLSRLVLVAGAAGSDLRVERHLLRRHPCAGRLGGGRRHRRLVRPPRSADGRPAQRDPVLRRLRCRRRRLGPQRHRAHRGHLRDGAHPDVHNRRLGGAAPARAAVRRTARLLHAGRRRHGLARLGLQPWLAGDRVGASPRSRPGACQWSLRCWRPGPRSEPCCASATCQPRRKAGTKSRRWSGRRWPTMAISFDGD